MLRGVTAISVLAGVLLLAGCGSSSKPKADPGTLITVSVDQCGTGWSKPAPGQQHFVLSDTDTRAGEVLLTDAKTGAVYADVEPVGAGTKASLDIELGSGSYAFRCAMEDEATVTGPTVLVPGNVPVPVAPVQPVTQADLITATKAYESYVTGQLPGLTQLTATLQAAIAAGNLAAAEAAWLPAHLAYERLGAAYDAFGDLDAAINGLPNGLPQGVNDPDWQGFHRIEYGLWHGASAASLVPVANELVSSVDALGAQFATAQIDPLDVSIRAHEITENALQFELTGQTDFGSNSNLATVRANLDGTVTVLSILRTLLTPRYSQLDATAAALTGAEHDLDVLAPTGTWPALDSLTTAHRERINADISNLSELLAPIASILEPRRDQ